MAKSRLSSKFNRCVKSVKKTVRARKGSNKESAAIGICTKSVLHKRGRTIKRYRKGRLITQKKFRGGATVEEEDPDPDPVPPRTWESIAGKLQLNTRFFGHNTNLMNNLEQTVVDEIRNVTSNATVDDIDNIIIILNFAIQKKSKKIIEALHARGVGKDTILMILDRLVEDPENARFRENIETLRPFVANLT